jgi:glycosyltransferase involved in cell wall biosynthesis
MMHVITVSLEKGKAIMIYLIIPAYNEEKRIAKTLDSFIHFIKEKQKPWHILVVVNGSSDQTERIVFQYVSQFSCISILNVTEKGKGRALKCGFQEALQHKENDVIGFVDADGATGPESFDSLLVTLEQHNKDVVIGSRYMPQKHTKRIWYKAIGREMVYHPLLYALFNVSFYDVQCGAKVFRKEVLQAIVPHLMISGWSIDLELLYLAKKRNFSIMEQSIMWRDQQDSKFTIFGGMIMIFDLFRLRYWHRNR